MTSTPNDPFRPESGDIPADPYAATPADPMHAETPSYSYGASGTVGGESGSGSSSGAPSDAAKQEAARLKDTTAGAASQVAGTAKEQVGQVAGTAKEQAGQLVSQTKDQLSEQAMSQRDRAIGGIRALSEEMQAMAECGQSGLGSQLVRQGSEVTGQVADFLEQREPAELVDELRTLARRRPGAFLVGAALAGVAVGRMTRGAISARSSDDDSSAQYDYSYDSGVGTASYTGGYPSGMSEPVAAPGAGSMPPPASMPVPPPVLDEPYGTGEPPAGYGPGAVNRP
jgi:uncharacterized protein YjbJ (UPF0337 family)